MKSAKFIVSIFVSTGLGLSLGCGQENKDLNKLAQEGNEKIVEKQQIKESLKPDQVFLDQNTPQVAEYFAKNNIFADKTPEQRAIIRSKLTKFVQLSDRILEIKNHKHMHYGNKTMDENERMAALTYLKYLDAMEKGQLPQAVSPSTPAPAPTAKDAAPGAQRIKLEQPEEQEEGPDNGRNL